MLSILKQFFDPKLMNKVARPGKRRKNLLFYNPPQWRTFIFGLGSGLFFLAIGVLIFFYTPLIKAIINYNFTPRQTETSYQPPAPPVSPSPDYSDFYIYIPKIKASSPIFPNISMSDEKAYLKILEKGVAHAEGSGLPGEKKTVYLFAHSTNSPFNAVRYNAVFFLLNQIKPDDDIILFFNGNRFKYKVYEKRIVASDRTEYLDWSNPSEDLILQTCWPPGTTWKRLLVFARKV